METKCFRDYVRELRSTYIRDPKELSVGFFAMCSYQPDAWDHVFMNIRKHYQTEPIVLLNDGMEQYDYSEMSKKYNCIHIKEEKNICLLWNDIEDSHSFMHRLNKTCDLLGTEWVINLHPDVICQHKICYYPTSYLCGVGCGSRDGISKNNFRVSKSWRRIEEYIRGKNPEVRMNGWGWCGGSIMKISIFKDIYNDIYSSSPHATLEEIEKVYKEAVRYEDTLLPVLFNVYGYEYRIWKDNPEFHRGEKHGAFLHGYKEHYDFKKRGETLEIFNERRHEQSSEKK